MVVLIFRDFFIVARRQVAEAEFSVEILHGIDEIPTLLMAQKDATGGGKEPHMQDFLVGIFRLYHGDRRIEHIHGNQLLFCFLGILYTKSAEKHGKVPSSLCERRVHT